MVFKTISFGRSDNPPGARRHPHESTVAAGLTGVDMVKRGGRVRRPAQNPGVFDAHVKGSELRIFTSGEDLYEEMIAAIDGAQRIIKFETYIWKSDPTGQRFMDAFNRAAARGVEVYVSYDGFGNLVVPPRFYRQLDPRIHVFRLPAFARKDEHLILPAFGRFTGGGEGLERSGWSFYPVSPDRVFALDGRPRDGSGRGPFAG